MANIKRPAVIIAAIFLLSAYLMGKGLSLISTVAAFLLLPVFIFLGIIKKQNRGAFFVFLIIFVLLYPSVFKSLSDKIKAERFELLKDEKSFTATVRSISYKGSDVLILADVHGENKRNMGKAVFTKATPDRLPDLYDEIYFEGRIYPLTSEKIDAHSLFGDENRYFADGCSFIADVDEMILLSRGESENPVHKYYFYITDNLKNTVSVYDGTDPFSYIAALLTGNRAFLSSETTENYSRSGLIPYLCISGLHVSITTGILIYFLKSLKIRRGLRVILAGILMIFMCFITGFSGSVMRASIMAAAVFLGDILERGADRFTSISVALFGVLLLNPYAVFDVGTQLSFIAMAGICNSAFIGRSYMPQSSFAFEKLKRLIAVGIIASGFVMIPILHTFGGAFLFSSIANIPAVIFTPIMYVAVFMAAFAFLPSAILYPLGSVFSLLVVLFEKLSETFASIPYSYAEFSCPVLLSFLFVFLLFINVICISSGKEKYIAFSGVMFATVSYISAFALHIMTIFFNPPLT